MDSDAISDVFDTPLTLKHNSANVIFNNDDNKYNHIIPCLNTRYATDTPLKDSSL